MSRLKIRRPEEWGIEPVPMEKRILRIFDLSVLWGSLGVGLLVLAAGSLLATAFGLTPLEALIVAFVGSVIGSVLLASASAIGATYGIPTMVSLRSVLGGKGSYVPTALNVLQLIGWAAFELFVMALAATRLGGEFIGAATMPFWILVFGVICSMLAIGGPVAVVRQWLEKGAVWLVVASTAWIAYQLLSSGVQWDFRVAPESFAGVASLALAVDLVIAMPISWWPLISDYNRFARRRDVSYVGTSVGYILSNTVFYFLGALLIFRFLKPDIIAGIALLNLGFVALLLILVDETDNAFADIYSTAVSCQNFLPKVRQWSFVIAAAVVSALAAFGLVWSGEGIGGAYESFLILIGALFVPLLGVLAADFFVVRGGKYQDSDFYAARPLRVEAFLSWLPGIVLYYGIFYGAVPVFPAFGASLPSFILSFVLHSVAGKAVATKREVVAKERI